MEKLFNYYLIKWTVLCIAVGHLVGYAVAFFLLGLDEILRFVRYEESYIYLLPLAGLLIGFAYHYWGKEAVKGNNLILEEINEPKKPIPFIMAPMVLMATWLTHFFGGSVGREGTAVQMGSAIADRFTVWFKLNNEDRKIVLLLGISAGFAAVFGTPLAGAIFALEVMALGEIRWKAFFPSIAVAYIAHFACLNCDVFHTEYHIVELPFMNAVTLGWTAAAGIIFGLCAYLFVFSGDVFKKAFEKYIVYAPLRPLLGGIVVVIALYFLDTNIYNSLGIEHIQNSFDVQSDYYEFLIKLLLTTFTLSAGFKGGEVTPLFFVGATLGSALFAFLPLPLDYLAAIGFVAVFAAATNTPIACAIMGIELFGINSGIFMGVVCITAYLCSGKKGIYSSQISSWAS
jgi:H+/Cl- antiporter ClcA